MLMKLVILAVAVGLATDDAAKQVICAETGFSRAAEARDLDLFLAYVDPDARFVARSVARGREEVAAAWAPMFEPDGPLLRWRPAIVELTADGKLALSRGPYRLTQIDEDGNVVHTWGHFNSTWRLTDDGQWRVLFDSGGDAGMTPTEEEIRVLESEPDCP